MRFITSGYSAGIYGVWQQSEDAGFLIDGVLQYSGLGNTIKGQNLISNRYDSSGINTSLMGAYTFKIAGDDSAAYYLRPQVKLSYLGVKSDGFTEANGTRIRINDGNIAQTKLGLRSFAKIKSATDQSFEVFAEFNWINHSDVVSVQMNETQVNSTGAKNVSELKLGVDARLNKSFSISGNVGYQKGSSKFQDASGHVGVRYQF